MILRDPSVNPVVEESEEFVGLGVLFDQVDAYFDALETQAWQRLMEGYGTLDY